MKYNMEDLINDSIRVYTGMIAVYPQFQSEEMIHVEELIPKFPGRFSSNNSTVSFIHNNQFYVTPYTTTVMETLRANGFRKAYFYVPFSNWDYPKQESYKWEQLRKKASDSYEEEFHEDCKEYCAKHKIGAISEESLQKCFKMPSSGVQVKHLYFEDCYYPIISTLDCVAVDKIGKYCSNNGRVVFVYYDGNTYVAKGYKIVDELFAAGYRESGLFVPFSNGEEICDPGLRAKWEALPKF